MRRVRVSVSVRWHHIIFKKRRQNIGQKLTTCVGSDDIGEIEIGDSLGQVLGELDGISVSSLPIWKGATKPPENEKSAVVEH